MSATEYIWFDPPERPPLETNEVHVWRVLLNEYLPSFEYFSRILSPYEQQRASRFHFQRDRNYFVIGRGMLKQIISRYIALSPGEVRFSYNQYGKPALNRGSGEDLRFNVSSSGDVALCAIALGREVGIDIELIREDFASFEIAERFFSTEEVLALRSVSPDQRTVAFFNCWTRKEAYIKAIGKGLSCPLNTFSVSMIPGKPAEFLNFLNGKPGRWTLRALHPAEGYAAAVAVEEPLSILRCWNT